MVPHPFVSIDHFPLPIVTGSFIRHIQVLLLSEVTTAGAYNHSETIGCASFSCPTVSFLLIQLIRFGHQLFLCYSPSLFLVIYIYCSHIFPFSFSFHNSNISCFVLSHSKTWFFFSLIFNSNFGQNHFLRFFIEKTPFFTFLVLVFLYAPNYCQRSVLNRLRPSPQAPLIIRPNHNDIPPSFLSSPNNLFSS